MIGRAAPAAGARRAAPRTLVVIGLAVAFTLALVAGRAGAPYLFKRSTLQSEVATQVRATTGLVIAARHARFDLLPRPHVVMTEVRAFDPSNTFAMEAETLDGDVRFLPLIVGRVELSAATLRKPRLRVDLDGPPMPPDSTIGRALRLREIPRDAEQRLGSITLVDGTVDVARGSRPAPVRFSDVNISVDWRNLDSAASLSGSLRVNGTTTDVAAWLAQPSKLIHGDHSALVAHIHSAPLDLSAKGDLLGTRPLAFKGHVTASAPALAPVLAFLSSDADLPAPFADAALDADVSIGQGKETTIDFQNFVFHADGNGYEGAIAYRGGAVPLVTGTLATEQLRLAPFTAALPRVLDADRRWTRTGLPPLRIGALDLDLRFSAAHMRLSSFSIDNAALSIMTRGDRIEIGLNDGRAYGGGVKGRVSLGQDAEGLNVRAAGTLAGADLASLSWDAVGRQLAGGTMSAAASLETTGESAAALAAHLQGWVKANAADGEVSGIDLGRDLREGAASAAAKTPSLSRTGTTSFSRVILGFQVANGIALSDGTSLRGANAGVSLDGAVDLGDRRVDLQATVRAPPPAAANPEATGPTAAPPDAGWRFNVEGPFEKLAVTPAKDRATAPP